jgi:hypothetical protein
MAAEGAARSGLWSTLAAALRRALAARAGFAKLNLAARRLAEAHSRDLLVACLSPAQRAEFNRTLGFTVRGQSGRHYRVAYGATANIEVLGQGSELAFRLCAAPDDLPTPAVMLAQKLMLETREAEFLDIAVRHPHHAAIVAADLGITQT